MCIYSWVYGLHWKTVSPPRNAPLKKTDPLSKQLSTANRFPAMGAHLSSPCWGFCLAFAYSGLIHAVTLAMNSCVQLPRCARQTLFPCDHPESQALMFFLSRDKHFKGGEFRFAHGFRGFASIVWVWDEHPISTLWFESEMLLSYRFTFYMVVPRQGTILRDSGTLWKWDLAWITKDRPLMVTVQP